MIPDLEAILENAHEAFISIDADGRVRAWNHEAEVTFGWRRDEALGALLRDLIVPPAYRERHQEGLQRFLETGDGPLLGRRIEITAVHRSGREFPVELTISALETGGQWTFHAFVHDISDRHAAVELQARLAAMIVESADAIISRAPDGRVTSWNPAAERLYGYSSDEMMGAMLDHLEPSELAGEAASLFTRALAGEEIHDFETQRVCKDGRVIDVALTISPIHDAGGVVREIAMTARDISARKQMERDRAQALAELSQTIEMRTLFVATASHELRTPLTSIGGFARTLLSRWDGLREDEKLHFVRTIDEQSQRLARLVNQVLVLSRVETASVAASAEPVVVREVVERLLRELDLGDVVRIDAAGDPVAYVDPDHIQQMLLNYLANARLHGAEPISVRLDGTDDAVEIRVCDSGRGVPDGFVPHLFETFTQAGGSDGTRNGTGLGLAIVRGLAEAAGGCAWYEANSPCGACFCLRLPTPAHSG